MTDASVTETVAPRARLNAAFIPLALTYLAVAINVTIANIALPSISVALKADNTDLAWIANANPLASAALILLAGGIGDRFGRKKILVFGVVVFLASSILCAVMVNPGQLIGARALSGVGAAFAMPAALVLVFDVVPRAAQATGIGFMSATQAIGALLGPLLGGLVLLAFWWGAAFLVVVPFLVIALIMGLWLLPKDSTNPHEAQVPLDIPAAVLTAVAGIGILYAVIEGSSSRGTSATRWVVALIVGLLAVVGLIWWERRAPHPMIDFAVVRRRQFALPTLMIFLVNFVLGGVMFMSTQYTQLVLGLSAFMAGAYLIPALLAWAASASLSAKLAKKFGAKPVLVAGFTLGASGLVVVASGGVAPNTGVLLLGMGLVGFIGVGPALLTNMSLSIYPDEQRTVGAALNSLAIRFRLAFGVAAFVSVLTVKYQDLIAPVLSSLSADDAATAASSLGGAVKVAGVLSSELGHTVLDTARGAFFSGYQIALLCAAGFLIAAALLAATLLPKPVETEADGP